MRRTGHDQCTPTQLPYEHGSESFQGEFMRRIRRTVFAAAIAAALLIGGSPASISTATAGEMRQAGTAGSTPKLTVASRSLWCPFGTNAVIRGALAGTATVAAQTVWIQAETNGSWATTGTVVTGSNGAFSYSVSPLKATNYRAVLAADNGVQSAAVGVTPRTNLLSFSGPKKRKRSIYWIASIRFKTVLSMMPPSYTITTQRLVRGKWKRGSSWKSHPWGTYFNPQPDQVYQFDAITQHKFPKRGNWRVRVTFPGGPGIGSTTSKWIRVKIT